MNGPQHYTESQTILSRVKNRDMPAEVIMAHAQIAQVHATLALVAATAEQRDHTPQHSWGGTSTLLESQSEWDGAINQ